MRARWRSLFKPDERSRYARNVLQMARANVLAQALPVLAAPLLTRLYAPADFGVLALFASALSLGLAFATLRFDWSVPNARSAQPAAALLVLGALALLAIAALGALSAAITRPWWPQAAVELGTLWLLLPLALLGGGAQQLLQAWHVRGAELATVGRSKVASSAVNLGVALAAALGLGSGIGAWGLVAGVVAGSWASVGTLWRRAEGLSAALRRLDAARLRAMVQRYGGESAWSTLVSVANAASFAVVPVLLARHYSVAEVGWYALMQRLALAPIGLVSAAVSQSFWAEAARLVRVDRPALQRLYRGSTRRMAWLSLPLVALCAAAPWYVGPLFGIEQWSGAGAVLAASTPMLVGQLVVSPLSHLVVHRRQHWQAVWDVLRLLGLVVVIEVAGAASAPFVVTVLALSLVMALMYGVLLLLNLLALR